jgi:hypothetical protein
LGKSRERLHHPAPSPDVTCSCDYCVDDIKQLDLHDLYGAMRWLGEKLAALAQANRWLPVASAT